MSTRNDKPSSLPRTITLDGVKYSFDLVRDSAHKLQGVLDQIKTHLPVEDPQAVERIKKFNRLGGQGAWYQLSRQHPTNYDADLIDPKIYLNKHTEWAAQANHLSIVNLQDIHSVDFSDYAAARIKLAQQKKENAPGSSLAYINMGNIEKNQLAGSLMASSELRQEMTVGTDKAWSEGIVRAGSARAILANFSEMQRMASFRPDAYFFDNAPGMLDKNANPQAVRNDFKLYARFAWKLGAGAVFQNPLGARDTDDNKVAAARDLVGLSSMIIEEETAGKMGALTRLKSETGKQVLHVNYGSVPDKIPADQASFKGVRELLLPPTVSGTATTNVIGKLSAAEKQALLTPSSPQSTSQSDNAPVTAAKPPEPAKPADKKPGFDDAWKVVEEAFGKVEAIPDPKAAAPKPASSLSLRPSR